MKLNEIEINRNDSSHTSMFSQAIQQASDVLKQLRLNDSDYTTDLLDRMDYLNEMHEWFMTGEGEAPQGVEGYAELGDKYDALEAITSDLIKIVNTYKSYL